MKRKTRIGRLVMGIAYTDIIGEMGRELHGLSFL